MTVIDVDQHLYETRDMWAEHIDPEHRDTAVKIEDDEVGTPWLTWQGMRLGLGEVQLPGETEAIGERHIRARDGLAPAGRYDELLPDDYWNPSARVGALDDQGLDEAVLFPNYGLLWERRLSADLPATLANMTAWNRWCTTVTEEGHGRLHAVGHLSLRDPEWLDTELKELSSAGVRLAMVAPALVNGKPMSHPDHDRLWAAFCDHAITPTFHVADQERPFDDAWYTDDDEFVSVLSAVFIQTGAALACTDLIVNGVLERFPDLRIGIVELSALWLPLYLLMLDGGWAFTARLNGRPPVELEMNPSDYFRRQIRVSSFAYEDPKTLAGHLQSDDLLMACSDYPHSEGSATMLRDYAHLDLAPANAPELFGANAEFLLRK